MSHKKGQTSEKVTKIHKLLIKSDKLEIRTHKK